MNSLAKPATPARTQVVRFSETRIPIPGSQAEGRILEQLGQLAEAFAIERAQLHSTLRQALELDLRGQPLFGPNLRCLAAQVLRSLAR